MSRAKEAVTGLLYLVLVAALLALSVMVYDKDFSHQLRVSVLSDSVGNELQRGSDVKVRGVLVGRVTRLSSTGSGARLELALDPAQAHRLPANLTAQLVPKTLFGERYVSLVIPDDPVGTLHAGSVIEQDRSPAAVELQQVFDHLLPVLQAIEPDKLAALLGELAQGLRGRGSELGTTITRLADYLGKLAPQVPQLAGDLDTLSTVARTYRQAAPSLVNALDDFTSTAQTIYQQRTELAGLFGSVTTAGNDLDGFVNTNASSIIGLSANSLPALRVVSRYSGEFPCLTRALAGFVPTAAKALGSGAGAHVTLTVVPSLGKYLAGRDTPKFTDDSGPRCPYVPGGTGLSNTAVGNAALAPVGGTVTSKPASAVSGQAALGSAVTGLGTANSTQENELIAELVAPTMGIAPSKFPAWGSLLLGPALRGTTVTFQ